MRQALKLLAPFLLAACGPQALPTQPLDGVAGWPDWPQDQSHGQVTAVDVDSRNRVYVLHRAGREWPVGAFPIDPIPEDTIFVFDGDSGALIDRWGSEIFTMPHGLSIAPDDSVWITDAGREQVLHFTPDGQLLETIGEEGVTGDDDSHFGRATDVAFDDGDVLVSDGYLNARVARYAPGGQFLSQFGQPGEGSEGFRLPHSVQMAGDRIVVADRENRWIKIFAPDGSLAAGWSPDAVGYPYAAKTLPGGGVVVAEGRDRDGRGIAILRLYGDDGSITGSYDLATGDNGPHRAHDLAIGPDGAIYVADVMGDALIKIAPGSLEKN